MNTLFAFTLLSLVLYPKNAYCQLKESKHVTYLLPLMLRDLRITLNKIKDYFVEVMLIDMKVGESLRIVPIPDTRHFPGIVVNKRSVSYSIGRERRAPKCGTGQYLHPNGTYCCTKCHPGTRVIHHCLGQGQTTDCTDCPEGQYMAQDNYAETCRQCQICRSAFGQIEIHPCTSKKNTVCGCGVNQYQDTKNTFFICKNCTACDNGTIRQQCSEHSDTICDCHSGFFLQTDTNTCSPCTSCSDGECKAHCVGPVISPPNSSDLKPLLGSLVVLFGAGFVLLLARRFLKKNFWKQLKPPFSSYPSVQHSGESVSKTTAEEYKTNDSLLKTNQKVVDLPQEEPISVSLPSQELPDCIKPAGESQIPNCHNVFYAIVDNVPVSRWNEFVRRLGLNENTIERTCLEHRHIREGQYEMLKQWRLQAGRGATVEHISSVLNQMELNGCSEAILEILPKQP